MYYEYVEYTDPLKDFNNVMLRLLKHNGYNARIFTIGEPGWENHELAQDCNSYIKMDHPKISQIGLRMVNPPKDHVMRDGTYTIDIHYVVPKLQISKPKEFRATLKYTSRGLFSKHSEGIAWLGRELSSKLAEDEPTMTTLGWQLKPYENITITPDPVHDSVHIVLRTRLTLEYSHPGIAYPWELPSTDMFKCIERIAGRIKDYAS